MDSVCVANQPYQPTNHCPRRRRHKFVIVLVHGGGERVSMMMYVCMYGSVRPSIHAYTMMYAHVCMRTW